MERYSILPTAKNEIEFLIIANTCENPINDFLSEGYFPFVENGDVIFDLAIINGMNFNRFIKATIRHHKLLPETIQVVSDIDPQISNISKEYFKANTGIVNRSTLPSAAKYLLMNPFI